MDPDRITIDEAAVIAGGDRAAVYAWMAHMDFPRPARFMGVSQSWSRAAVEEWAARTPVNRLGAR
ncbi:MAG: AlpA family phage regulatory protein [Sphingomonadaceae bacterium]|nr:AlpA family phage regulatory protein [Sphingomonadaceae bacterium]